MTKLCDKCGTTERTKEGTCRECNRLRSNAWYEEHKNTPHVKAARRSWYRAHKPDVEVSNKKWASANPDAYEETRERSRLKKYGLTPEQHQALLEKQGGLCRICGEPFGRRIHIDHDHKTGVVRGLLCHRCNVGLGHFRDSPLLLQEAAKYLEVQTPTGLIVRPERLAYRPGDGRFKITDLIRADVYALREQGLSLGQIGKRVGLARGTVQVVLKGGGPSTST